MKTLTREHQAVFNFKTGMDQLRPIVTDQESIYYTRFFDSFDGAISNFIQTELFLRQAERCRELDVNSDLENYSFGYGTKLNQQGIDILKDSIAFLKEFKKSLNDEPIIDDEFQTILNNYHIDLKETLVHVELKASDVKEIDQVIESTLSTLATGNTGIELISYIESNLEKLVSLRNEPGRGAEKNIAVWKIVAAAVILGLGAWIVYKCYYSPWRCSSKEKKIYNTILAIALITFGACE